MGPNLEFWRVSDGAFSARWGCKGFLRFRAQVFLKGTRGRVHAGSLWNSRSNVSGEALSADDAVVHAAHRQARPRVRSRRTVSPSLGGFFAKPTDEPHKSGWSECLNQTIPNPAKTVLASRPTALVYAKARAALEAPEGTLGCQAVQHTMRKHDAKIMHPEIPHLHCASI